MPVSPDLDLPEDGVVRILSDLHLGHPGSICRSVDEFRPLMEGVTTLVLNGDTTEDCSSQLASESLKQYDALIQMTGACGVAVVRTRGNHDPDAEPVGCLWAAGRKVLVTHGDVCFPYGSPWSGGLERARPALERVACEHGEVKTLDQRLALARDWAGCFHPPVRKVTSRVNGLIRVLLRAFWPPSAAWRLISTRMAALGYVDRFLDEYAPDVRVMVFGHIHRAGVWSGRRGGRTLINTGAFQPLAGRVACDLDVEGITVRKIVRGKDGRWVTAGRVWHASWESLGA
ncbi:metallophosphoesterase [Sulfuriroseicoccus oceanibius]|uniref:Metallophosphoesterase n=1 Tax=Sulfuriroseicoccus oceanibius TaxID=2707525 RepID=A0A6B3L4H8_9BACT|nr:metallophosphoesterase [Sulfuriroseicoccus oceanibius]QQL45230.1 metallophosphoesterase [Sulfuriroseicoccus oceanibius]